MKQKVISVVFGAMINKLIKLNLVLIFILFLLTARASVQIDSLAFGSFGKVMVYKPSLAPKSFVLFISGDGGWNSAVIDISKNVVAQGALMIGIDIKRYYRNIRNKSVKCHYPAADFEELSMMIQKKYKIPDYFKPILVGYSSGATLAYGILAQSPSNTFKGAIALGFCPDIEINKPLCEGSALKWHVMKTGLSYYLEPCDKISAPFIILQGMDDKVCSLPEIQKYITGITKGELVILPKVGHGFKNKSQWLPQFITAFNKIKDAPSYQDKLNNQNSLLQSQKLMPLPYEFPLTIIPTSVKDSLPMAFVISGDGGWTSFDQSFSENLAARGIAVIGLDAQKYFWNAKKPDNVAQDVFKAITHYMQLWNKRKFILIGYSFGADIVPFMASRTPETLKNSLSGVFCFSPDIKGDFEIHVSDMLSFGNSNNAYDIVDEIKHIRNFQPVCVFGDKEEPSDQRLFSLAGARIVKLAGNHHYNNDFTAITDVIFKSLIR